jgi:hypothetical protein
MKSNERTTGVVIARVSGAVVATITAVAALIVASNSCGIALWGLLIGIVAVPVTAIVSVYAVPQTKGANRLLLALLFAAPAVAAIVGFALRVLPPNGCP